MARVKKQQRRAAGGEWVRSGDRSMRRLGKAHGRVDPVDRALCAIAECDTRRARKRGRRLVFWVWECAPPLLSRTELIHTLAEIDWPNTNGERLPAVNEPTEWDLVQALLARFPIPDVLTVPFRTGSGRIERRVFAPLASHVAAGGTLSGAKAQGLVPSTTTRRMYGLFLRGHLDFSMRRAWRIAQARALGAPAWVGAEVQMGERWFVGRRDYWDDEAYWISALRWFARTAPERGQVARITRYLAQHQVELRRRTLASVERRVQQWEAIHLAPSQRRPPDDLPLFPKVELSVQFDGERWSIHQIREPVQLWEEGRRMHHCVWSYRSQLADGRCSIWSLNHDGVPHLTVQVAQERIIQVKGPCNRRPDESELRVLERWAESNGLRL